ncbi:hypothetical protein ACOSQ4_013235 [Xanthoceras sorbifolium]
MIRGITLDDSCFDCGESCEDLNHLFRQCTTTIETWKSCWVGMENSTWVKVNVDGSHRCNSNLIAVGGVIRNSERGWLAGFATKKGAGSVLGAELWGIIEGLKLAWSSGCNKVIVETDSLEAVESLSTSNIC